MIQHVAAMGDLHGRDDWKKIPVAMFDKVILMGDYVDSYTISPDDCYRNLSEIMEWKAKHGDKIILLWGNHDIHYVWLNPDYRATGYEVHYVHLYQKIYCNISEFKVAHQMGNYLFTHAGITDYWKDTFLKNTPINKLSDTLNELILTDEGRASLFRIGYGRGGLGPGGPIWADKKEMDRSQIKNLHQIVGHTAVSSLTIEKDKIGNSNTYFIDCLPKTGQYLTLSINLNHQVE